MPATRFPKVRHIRPPKMHHIRSPKRSQLTLGNVLFLLGIGLIWIVGAIANWLGQFSADDIEGAVLTPALKIALFCLGVYVLYFVIRKARKWAHDQAHQDQLRKTREDLMREYENEEVVDLIMQHSVWQGMSEDQLIDALGEPGDTVHEEHGEKKKETWKYDRQGKRSFAIKVDLVNGVVVGGKGDCFVDPPLEQEDDDEVDAEDGNSTTVPTLDTTTPLPQGMNLETIAGNKSAGSTLERAIIVNKQNATALEHVLIVGDVGERSLILSRLIAANLGVTCKGVSAPVLETVAELASLLTNLEERDVLFIDEIHRLKLEVEELLCSAMEDFQLDLIIGEGPAERSVKLDLHKFTLIASAPSEDLLRSKLSRQFKIRVDLG